MKRTKPYETFKRDLMLRGNLDPRRRKWQEARENYIYNEGLNKLYASPNIIKAIKTREMRWTSMLTRMEKTSNAYKIMVRKSEGKRLWKTEA
jgi:hypothetical protein